MLGEIPFQEYVLNLAVVDMLEDVYFANRGRLPLVVGGDAVDLLVYRDALR